MNNQQNIWREAAQRQEENLVEAGSQKPRAENGQLCWSPIRSWVAWKQIGVKGGFDNKILVTVEIILFAKMGIDGWE